MGSTKARLLKHDFPLHGHLCLFLFSSCPSVCPWSTSVFFGQLMKGTLSRERFGIATLLCNAVCDASAGLSTHAQI